LEPLYLLFNLLWVDLHLTILRLLIFVSRRHEEMALLEKGLEASAQAVIGP